jgi:hypothetical protein
MDWRTEKEQKRAERETARFQRYLVSPVLRGEVLKLGEEHLEHIASLALAVEALEDILIAQNILRPDELLTKMKALAEKKAEQTAAADLTEKEN